MQPSKLAFIGAGNMSRAIISGLITNGHPAARIIASNPSTPKLDALKTDFGIETTQHNADAVNASDVVFLSVKPQLMAQVCEQLSAATDLTGKLFVSVAAGINIQRMQAMLGDNYPLIRTMPNTPCALGKGVIGLYSSQEVSASQQAMVTSLLSNAGVVITTDSEAQIDGVIAAAGSSPAYFFLFLENMQSSAVKMGFSQQQARLMVQQAMLGAAEMVCHNPEVELAELRAQVTSKGGTTAKAVEFLQDGQLANLIDGAMNAAVIRAREMSEQF